MVSTSVWELLIQDHGVMLKLLKVTIDKLCISVNIKSRLGGAANRIVRSTQRGIAHQMSLHSCSLEIGNIEIFMHVTFAKQCFNNNLSPP
jgi:light-regulated signal transduction histidine kinase (bacteriophytochrome)